MAYARISLNNSSPFLTLRQRLTVPVALANSLKSSGKYWHRYFQSWSIKCLSIPGAYMSYRKSQFLILAPMPPDPLPQGGEGRPPSRCTSSGGGTGEGVLESLPRDASAIKPSLTES